MIKPNLSPWILVDLSRNRIRIPKHTLRALGNPGFVRLLINPENRTLAVEVCEHTEPRKHRVPDHVMKSKQCFEIQSMSLCDQLCMHTNWEKKRAYKLFAKGQAGEQLLLYHLDEAYLSAGGMIITESPGKETDNE